MERRVCDGCRARRVKPLAPQCMEQHFDVNVGILIHLRAGRCVQQWENTAGAGGRYFREHIQNRVERNDISVNMRFLPETQQRIRPRRSTIQSHTGMQRFRAAVVLLGASASAEQTPSSHPAPVSLSAAKLHRVWDSSLHSPLHWRRHACRVVFDVRPLQRRTRARTHDEMAALYEIRSTVRPSCAWRAPTTDTRGSLSRNAERRIGARTRFGWARDHRLALLPHASKHVRRRRTAITSKLAASTAWPATAHALMHAPACS